MVKEKSNMEQAKSDTRKKRVPLGVPRLKLAMTCRAGYRRRWINDAGDRLNQALEGGYSLVPKDEAEYVEDDTANRNDSLNNAICKTVNSDGTKAYLMEIPTSLYNKDQLAKAAHIDETEEGLRRGADTHGQPGSDGRYIPREGIKIS